MEQKDKTALVAGATGLVGHHCLDFLLKDITYQRVDILTRRELNLQHDKLQQHIVDFDHLEKYKAQIKADDIFCCLGTTIKKAGTKENFKKVDLQYPLEIARIARENGAGKYLIVTALGADKGSFIFYNKIKGQVEEGLRALNYGSVHIFRPSLLLGERKEQRLGEQLSKTLYTLTAPLFAGPFKKYKGIQGKAVAHAMVQCAHQDKKGLYIHESQEIQSIYDNRDRA